MMDNSRLIVIGEHGPTFQTAIRLAFESSPSQSAEAWWVWNPKIRPRSEYDKDRPEELLGVVSKASCLVYAWHLCAPSQVPPLATPSMHPFPSKIGWELGAQFAWDWLAQQDYGAEPDHDGSNDKGFIIFNDAWGHVLGDNYSFIAIGPALAMYGK